MALRLSNKVAIVTGSSSGFGRAISLAYAREGASIVCADLKREARIEISDEANTCTDELITAQGGRAFFVKTNVSSPLDFEYLVQEAVRVYGRLDILVNNAGVAMETTQLPVGVHETPESVWDTTMAVNAKSVFLGSKYAAKQMLQQPAHPLGHRGWIVNIASALGVVGGRYNPSYSASKAAVVNLTRQIALDYGGEKIHSNVICPGYTKTAILANAVRQLITLEDLEGKHSLGLGVPEDIVGIAVLLASDEARWITGATFSIDGGYVAQ